MLFRTFYLILFLFLYIQKHSSLYFLFLFLACLVNPSKAITLFSPSVSPHSLFSPKHKWMHGHLSWESQGHTLEASQITLPCVTGCRICPGLHYLKGWVGAWKKCVCVLDPASSRSANAGLQQIQLDFWVKYNIERLQVFLWVVWTAALLNNFPPNK